MKNTLEKAFTKLDTPISLSYSAAGRVVEVGSNMSGLNIGDRVACGGAGYDTSLISKIKPIKVIGLRY